MTKISANHCYIIVLILLEQNRCCLTLSLVLQSLGCRNCKIKSFVCITSNLEHSSSKRLYIRGLCSSTPSILINKTFIILSKKTFSNFCATTQLLFFSALRGNSYDCKTIHLFFFTLGNFFVCYNICYLFLKKFPNKKAVLLTKK